MKTAWFIILLFIYTINVFAQKETFDLIIYTPPMDWKKEVSESSVSYTKTDNKTGNWCQLRVLKSTISKGNIDADFESEWNEFAVKNYGVKDAPQTTEVEDVDGWKAKSGAGKFTYNNADASVLLTTASGYERCVSIVAITNSSNYTSQIQRFLELVDLLKPNTAPSIQVENSQQTTSNSENASVIGTWYVSASNQGYDAANGMSGYIKRQYTFNQDGSYQFAIKTFSHYMNKLLLTKESGTYQVSGNSLSINPQSSVIQSWSKKDGTDKWGSLLSNDNRPSEKTTYQFSKQYFSGIQQWQLVLQANQVTQRDGPFVSSSAFSNAWIYGSGDYPVELPE